MSRLPLALCAVAVFASPADAQKLEPNVPKADLRAILEKARKKHDVPALGAAVVTGEGLAALAVVGVRKRGAKAAAEEGDLFHIGSDTKAMTATLVAVLVQKKLLSYDRTLGEAFPDLKGKLDESLAKATLRQLLTHHAGLPADLEWEKFSEKGGAAAQREEAVRRLAKVKPKAKPGEKFLYSNLGYVLAGRMAERAAKKSWEELLDEYVAKPLKMRVGHGAAGAKGKVDQPWPHDEKGEPVEPGPDADNPPVMGPAASVHCSLADWGKFLADQLRGPKGKGALLPASAYKSLHLPANKGEKYTPGGWLVVGAPGGVLGHDGSNTMNYATAVMAPKLGVAVVVVCNQGGDHGQQATHQAREAILEKLLAR